jgi:hypothetical protein
VNCTSTITGRNSGSRYGRARVMMPPVLKKLPPLQIRIKGTIDAAHRSVILIMRTHEVIVTPRASTPRKITLYPVLLAPNIDSKYVDEIVTTSKRTTMIKTRNKPVRITPFLTRVIDSISATLI